ncbi:transposase [Mesorhizobium sp. M1328]|uniref:transposase n=1 Tax=Mesorhizobium sp. M1328 TaxID=2957082 RepID=UPI0033371845
MSDDRSFHVIEAVDAFKQRIIAETLMPGANVSAIARREGIAPPQLFTWRRKAIENGKVTPGDSPSPALRRGGNDKLIDDRDPD